jgi:gas vesicle protein
MTTTKKIIIGLGVAGGALLAAWLLTGDRGKKTKEFVAKKAEDLKQSLKKEKITESEDSEVHYV